MSQRRVLKWPSSKECLPKTSSTPSTHEASPVVVYALSKT